MPNLKIIIFIILCFVTSSSAQWVQTSGPEEGTVRHLLKVTTTQNDTKIYAGTLYGGLFSSNNLGESWSPVLKDGKTFSSVRMLKKIGDFIYLMSLRGFYRSTDNGISWHAIGNGIPSKEVSTLSFNKGNIYGSSGSGVFVSSNNGESWSLFTNELLNLRCVEACDSAIIIAADGKIKYSRDLGHRWNDSKSVIPNSIISYLSFHGKYLFCTMNYALHRSSDYGASWIKSDSGMYNDFGGGIFVRGILESGSDLYAATLTGIFKSTDNGISWEIVSKQTIKFATEALEKIDNILLAGTDKGGFYKSTDFGNNWFLSNKGFIASEVDVMAANDTSLFVGLKSSKTLKSTDNGATWKKINLSAAYSTASSLLLKDNVLVKTYYSSPIMYSSDFGDSWNTFPYIHPANVYINAAIYDDGIFVGTEGGGVFHKSVFSQPWTAMNSGLTFLQMTSLIKIGETLFASSRGGDGVFRSTDKGLNWTPYNSGLTDKYVYQICQAGKSIFASTQSGLFCFNGSTWLEVFPKFQDVIYMFARDNNLFVSRSSTLWMTSDNGQNWSHVDSELFVHPVAAMAVSGDYLYAGTQGGGVFRRPLSELIKPTGIKENNEKKFSFFLEQNYPNPFNPKTTVRYSVPIASHVSLRVYDLLGKEVKILANEFKNSGAYDVSFNGSDLPSGVYLYILQAGSYRESKKLIILK